MAKRRRPSSEALEAIHRAIANNRLTFIEYPDPVPTKIWKRGDGETEFIDDMKLDHLKNAILRVRKDRATFLKHAKHELHSEEVIDAVLPMIDKKLAELELSFRRRTRI